MENCENDCILEAALEKNETDSLYEADSVSIGVTDDSFIGSVNNLGVRRGSACRQLHPLPTIQQVDQGVGDMLKMKQYVKKVKIKKCENYPSLIFSVVDQSHG